MTDDTLLTDRFAALASPLDDSDWLDVRRRAGVRRGRRTWLALPLAAAVAAIAVGSALALYRNEIDFWSSPPAPEHIIVDYENVRAHADVGFGWPSVIPGEARRVAFFELDGEPRPLFVVPTEEGGFCSRLHFHGTCGRTGLTPSDFDTGGLQSEHGSLDWIRGHFLDADIRRLELEYADGTSALVPFVWVTAPIEAGFYALDIPPEHEPLARRATFVVAYDEDDVELVRRELPFDDPKWQTAPDGLPRVADRMQKRTLFDFRDHLGVRRTLVVAPAPEEKLCYAYEFSGGCFSPRFPPVIGAMSIGGRGKVVDLCCGVSEDVAKVVLHYEDGVTTELEPVDGFLLYVIPPEHYARGHRVERLAWVDAADREIASRTFRTGRGLYPCEKSEEIDLGHGITMCP